MCFVFLIHTHTQPVLTLSPYHMCAEHIHTLTPILSVAAPSSRNSQRRRVWAACALPAVRACGACVFPSERRAPHFIYMTTIQLHEILFAASRRCRSVVHAAVLRRVVASHHRAARFVPAVCVGCAPCVFV